MGILEPGLNHDANYLAAVLELYEETFQGLSSKSKQYKPLFEELLRDLPKDPDEFDDPDPLIQDEP